VVDGRGRVRWTHRGDAETRLLVLVCHSTPLSYLGYLRQEQIPYLVAGAERVDLPRAMALLHELLGVTCVVSEAGGGLNGALLRAGLVDELHLILLPVLVGGRDTPATFDGPALRTGDLPASLELLDVQTSADGAVWLHYSLG
jgi:2,5-diamino-6-(ribosylamino)-4(3H)-pyrimidinone 5'-phosphate reductase